MGLALLASATAEAQSPGGPIQQTGFGGHGGAISRHLHPYPVDYRQGGAPPRVTYEYVPPHERGGHLAAIGEGARSLWYRLEYLNWTIEDPGQDPLGARLTSDQPFNATVNGVPSELGIQPDGRAFDLQKNNGLRFTIGAPTRVGDFEASVFVLEQADANVALSPERRFDQPEPAAATTLDPITGLTLTGLRPSEVPNVFPATTFTVNGNPDADTMILYNGGYIANYKTDIFGTEANFVFNPLTPNQPLTFRPILGFQYINFRENMLIAGSDTRMVEDQLNSPAMVPVTLDHRIDVRARNNLFAPQIGVRAEFAHEWFSIGVTPKFMLGFNRRQDDLRTSEIFPLQDLTTGAFIDDGTRQREEATEFSPSFDLKVDARIHINEHFSLVAGYQLYVLSNISRPLNNVNYDTIDGETNNINLNTLKQHQVWFGNLTVGGEIYFH